MMRTKNTAQTHALAATLCLLATNLVANAAQALPGEMGILPKPVKLEVDAGAFPLSAQCNILYQQNSPDAKAAAEYLAEAWRKVTRLPLPLNRINWRNYELPAPPNAEPQQLPFAKT